jgi:hypothetical protein
MMDELDVTPPPVSRLQFEREAAERVTRGQPPPTCRICEILLSWFLDPPRRRTRRRHDEACSFERGDSDGFRWEAQSQVIHLGTFGEAVASPCSQHTDILKYLRPSLTDDNHEIQGDVDHESQSDEGVDLTYTKHFVFVRGPFSYWRGKSVLQLIDRPGVEQSRGQRRVLDQQWVDLPVISQWMVDCSESHGEECENPMKIMRVVPDLLVDVKRKRIVKGRETLRYMALSYRLGNAAPFRLSLSDLDKLGKDAILENEQVLERLPLTVRHAMLLANELGYEYLWTDVLCVLHDGPATLGDQLNKMSAIYASAAMTIVSTDGDGTDGIPGLHGISGPRDLQQATFAIRDEHLIVPNTDSVDVTNPHTDYHRRGWTYQEFIMSPRKLVFMNQQAHWWCQCYQRFESDARNTNKTNDTSGVRRFDEFFDRFRFIRSGYPDLRGLSNLLSLYNMRSLTYSGDALPAISGLLTVLSRGFAHGFLHGIPEKFFDIALSWRPYRVRDYKNDLVQEELCKSRRPSALDCESGSTTLGSIEIPSWSWAAWQTAITFQDDEVAQVESHRHGLRDVPDGNVFRVTSPITEWCTGSEP